MKNILFVCSGNTCRSPMAAAVMNAIPHRLCNAESAGIGAFSQDPLSEGAREVLLFTGTPVAFENSYLEHRSRPLCSEDMEKYDLVVGMTQKHTDWLLGYFPNHKHKIRSFPLEIADPFGCDRTVYLNTLVDIRKGVAQIYRELFLKTDGIFPMTESDILDILKIETESFSNPWSQSSFQMSFENPITHGIVKIQNQEIKGYAIYSVLFEDAELLDIAVSPTSRKNGAGQALLTAVVQDCIARNATCIRLEVRNSNTAARKLYEKHGFSYDGIRKNYYKNPTEDAYLMCLTVNEVQKETL